MLDFFRPFFCASLCVVLSLGYAVEIYAENSSSPHRVMFYPTKGSDKYPLILEFYGETYGDRGISLKDGDKNEIMRDSLLRFLRDMHELVKSDDQEAYIDVWQKPYKPELKKLYDENPDAWSRFRELISSAADYRVMKAINYGDYTIAQLLYRQPNGNVYASSISLVRVNDVYFRTQDLKNDVVATYLTQIDGQKNVRDYRK